MITAEKECDLHMVKVIMGLKGSGKTKSLVEMIRKAAEEAHGDVVCIEKDKNLTYDIPYTVRLIHASEYGINSSTLLRGFISGLHAGNYDITHFFIDNFYKLVGDNKNPDDVVAFTQWLDRFAERENIEFVISMSSDKEKCPEVMKQYLI